MLLRRLAVPALVAPAVLLAAGPAAASDGLIPGGTQTFSIQLPGTWAKQADQLGVSVVNLTQAENECLPGEIAARDTTCDADGGDLAGQLVAEVAAGSTGGSGNCQATTAWFPLDLLHSEKQSRFAVSGAHCLAVRLTFPSNDDDNVAQSDSISFGVQTVAEGPDGGVSGGSGPAAASAGGGVASAGSVGGANRGRGLAAAGNAAGGVVPQVGGTSGTVATGSGGGRSVLGRQTTPAQVGADSVAVQTEAASRPIEDIVLTWGALFVGVVVLGVVFVLWLSRRRRREA
jgi:hypothetical protein